MTKTILFALKSTGSIDLLISCALSKNLPIDITSIEIVSDSFAINSKIVNSKNELNIIHEELGIKIYPSPFFIRNIFLFKLINFLHRFMLSALPKNDLILRISYKLISVLHTKSIKRNLKKFKKNISKDTILFIERNIWHNGHIFIKNTFSENSFYVIPDAPLREIPGYSNNLEFKEAKNLVLLLPNKIPDINNLPKIYFEPIPGNKKFKNTLNKLKSAYKEKYPNKNNILILLQKYSDTKSNPECISWKERVKLIKFLKIENLKSIFKEIETNKEIKIFLSNRISLPTKEHKEEFLALKKLIKIINQNHLFKARIDENLSIANSIKFHYVYSEFTTSCFYFICSNIYISKGKSFNCHSSDPLINEDYQKFEKVVKQKI